MRQNPGTTPEALALIKNLMSTKIPPEILKAAGWSQPSTSTTGLQGYNLVPRALQLFPVLAPLRQMIPRQGGGFGTAVNWRALTGINTTFVEPGMSEGNRGQYVTHTTKEYSAAYKTLGLDDFVTEQAQWAGRTFEDILALGTDALLWSLMIAEENVILGGNNSLALGTTPTPVPTAHATGGTLAHATYSVICVALSHNALYAITGGAPPNANSVIGTAPVRGLVSGTTANGQAISYGGGAAQKSAAATATVASPGGAGSITAHVAAVNGAVAYAWFWGPAASEVLGAITTINSVLITAAATGSQTPAAFAADHSTNTYVYDGILSQIWTSGSGAQQIVQATGTDGVGTPLTAVGDGGIVEFDTLLENFWNVSRLSPDTFWMNAQERNNLQRKIQAGSNNATQRFIFSTDQKSITGSSMATGYINKFGMSSGGAYAEGNVIEFRTHPNIAPGTIMATSKTLPYMNSGVPNVLELDMRLDYYQRQYAPTAPAYQFGVYCDGVLKVMAPFALGSITNIGNG